MSLVVAIDVGVKNLAICAYDFLTSQVVHWDNVSLTQGKYVPMLNVQYVRDFVKAHERLFYNAAAVVIERQMRCNMRIIEACLHTMFFDRCTVISAKAVKMHYGLSTRNYKGNKAKAVDWARMFVATNASAITESCAQTFIAASKKDDLADALVLAMYYLDTYSNQVNVTPRHGAL